MACCVHIAFSLDVNLYLRCAICAVHKPHRISYNLPLRAAVTCNLRSSDYSFHVCFQLGSALLVPTEERNPLEVSLLSPFLSISFLSGSLPSRTTLSRPDDSAVGGDSIVSRYWLSDSLVPRRWFNRQSVVARCRLDGSTVSPRLTR